MAYDVVSNATLWFLHHGLFDLSRRPRLDRRWTEAWDAYRDVNHAFARAVIDQAEEGAVVLVQDYHLSLVGTWLAQERPDLRAVHFTHTPFCDPDLLRVLPSAVAEELLGGMASHTACGFHARRWADNFAACCEEVLGLDAGHVRVAHRARPGGDRGGGRLRRVRGRGRAPRRAAGAGGMLIARVDRIELSKNLLRGFLAFDDLLRTRPEWRGRVVFLAQVYPSRESLPEYLAYRQEVEGLARLLNERWATPGWDPIILDTSDNYSASVAALVRYDVLLVNPVRDGLNLVAKEGALLNRNDGVLALSREAGAWDELGGTALEVNPFDVAGTSDVLSAALTMAPADAGRPRRRPAQGGRGPRPPRLARPTSWRRPLPARRPALAGLGSDRRARAWSRLRAPSGPSTTTSARSSSSDGDSALRTATRATVTSPSAAASRSRASKASRSPRSSPSEQHVGEPGGGLGEHQALVVGEGRAQLVRHAGRRGRPARSGRRRRRSTPGPGRRSRGTPGSGWPPTGPCARRRGRGAARPRPGRPPPPPRSASAWPPATGRTPSAVTTSSP